MPRGIDTLGVEELPQGDETSGVTPKGNGVTGTERRGWGGDGNSPATHDTKASGYSGSSKEMASGPGLASSIGRKVSMHRNINSADGARPEHGMLVHRRSQWAIHTLLSHSNTGTAMRQQWGQGART